MQVKKTGPVDIMHYHFTGRGFAQSNWEHIKDAYEKIMMPNTKINYITILRNHREHYLSYYYYYLQPVNQVRRLTSSGVLRTLATAFH